MPGENTALSENRSAAPVGVSSLLSERFVLEERIEQGRLGTMYRALDRLRGQEGRTHVAVLVLPGDLANNPDRLDAFERELEAVRLLSHPNIVRIFSLERDGPIAFVVLEWVDGESLRSVIDSLAPETVCEADALAVVRAVGNALVYAHARGIVHGDIRPENIVVTARGEVRLHFTSAGLAKLSPFTVDARDDVRGLAALAYELMAGAPPPIASLYPGGKAYEPKPIGGLSRKRWKALRSALSRRDGRIRSVRGLLAALELPEPRAPRQGSRPDRLRGESRGGGRRAALVAGICIGIAAIAAGGAWLSRERAASLPDFRALPAAIETGAGRAAELTLDGWAGARDQLQRAGSALAALWSAVAGRVRDASGNSNEVPPAVESAPRAAESVSASTANDAVRSTELFESEEFNHSGSENDGPRPPDAGATESSRADASAAPADDAAARAQDGSPLGGDEPEPRESRPDSSVAEPLEAAPDAAESAPRASVPRIAFSREEYSFSEGDGVATIEVSRNDARGQVSFVWWTRDGSAVSGDDYAELGRRTEQFSNGETTKVLYVPIISDSIPEERREYFEVLFGPVSAEGNQDGALESARVTIVDDDR